MKTKSLVLAFGLLLSSLGAACSGSDGPASLALDDVPAQQAAIFCQKSFSCCDATELAARFDELGGAPADEAACRALLVQVLDLDREKELIASGKVRYDEQAAGDCIALARSLSCSDFGDGDVLECESMLVGQVAEGQACERDAECAGRESGTHACNGSVCIVLPRSGEECSDRCIDGLACIDGSCKPELPDGAACTWDGDCENHNCLNGSDGVPTCQPRESQATCDGN